MAADKNYCVMNHQKYSYAKGDNLKGLQDEQNREADYYNDIVYADKTKQNVALVYSNDFEGDMYKLCKEYGVEVKDDSVLMIGTVYTMSPEWLEEKCKKDKDGNYTDESKELIESYFYDCVDFHKQHYGIVISAHIHYDQTTPHLQVYSVPILRVPTLHNYYIEAEEKTVKTAITEKQKSAIIKRYEKAKKTLEKVEKMRDDKADKVKLVDKAKKALKAAEISKKEAEAGEHTEVKLVAKKGADGKQIRISEEGTPEEYKERLKQPKIRKREKVKDENGRVVTHWALGGNFALGGASDLSKQQTEFAEKVGAKYGLERGVIRVGTDEYRAHRTSKQHQVEQLEKQNANLVSIISQNTFEIMGLDTEVSVKKDRIAVAQKKLDSLNERVEEASEDLSRLQGIADDTRENYRASVVAKEAAADYADEVREQAEAAMLDRRDAYNKQAEAEYNAFLQRMAEKEREAEEKLDKWLEEQKKQIKVDTSDVQADLIDFLKRCHCTDKDGNRITWLDAYVIHREKAIEAKASQRKKERRDAYSSDAFEDELAKYRDSNFNILSKF